MPPTNPHCLTCKVELRTDGRYWQCKSCESRFRKQTGLDPRHLKKELNAWCLNCRVPMRKRSDAFNCESCQTFVQIKPTRKPLLSSNPCCLHCHYPMCSMKAGMRWACNRCKYNISVHRDYQPAKKRAKGAANAWCVQCRVAMERHGVAGRKIFFCPECRATTRLRATSYNRVLSFSERSKSTTGRQIAYNSERAAYPWCVTCQRRMQNRLNKSYRCGSCRTIVSRAYSKGGQHSREQEILRLLQAGYLDYQIIKQVHAHHKTVTRLRKLVLNPALCECGRLKQHRVGCLKKDEWARLVREQKPVFEAIISQINAQLPHRIPSEMRKDIKQAVLLDIVEFASTAVKESYKYVRDYNRMFPYNRYISLDANTRLAAVLEG